MTPQPGYPQDMERMIDERIGDLAKRLDEIESERSTMRNDLADIKEIVSDLKSKYVHIQEESAVKLEEYSKDLESVGAHIKALERVLQRVFSATAQNMRELSEIVRTMKQGAPSVAPMPPEMKSLTKKKPIMIVPTSEG